MAERLADITARTEAVRQLSVVVSAMRAIAASRAAEARARTAGLEAYTTTITRALSMVVGEASTATVSGDTVAGARLVIALGAEQGFAGAFNDRIMRAIESAVDSTGGRAILFLVGSRAIGAAGDRGLETAWRSPMMAHADQTESLAIAVADALESRLAAGEVSEVVLLHARVHASGDADVVTRRVVPVDVSRFAAKPPPCPPLRNLSPERLLASLAGEYVFAEICEALMLSFAAENDARMRSMSAAGAQIDAMLDDLTARSRRLRQEEITDEIVGLSAGLRS